MKSGISLGLAAVSAVSIALCCGESWGSDTYLNLPPKCKDPDKKCDCENGNQVQNGCIKVTIDLGETTPWTGSIPCELKIFADNDSPSIFTADSLYAILGGYTFKRLGTQNLSDGATPAEVVLSRKNGEPVHFVFRDGESMAQPDPGVHIKMDERLQMVDAEGWATASDPVYYDLYVGDGTKRRFLATDMTGALGSLVSITDARGVTATPEEMGIDIVYDSNGVRQFLTPSRLANITLTADFSGYDVTVYALQDPPAKDAQTRLYPLPAGLPVEVISIRRENNGKRAVVTQQKGGGEAKRYVFDYALGDWSLRRPSGMEERKERYIADEKDAKVIEEVFSAAGVRLSRTEYNYKWESWGFALTNKVEGFDGLTNITTWTYYTSGNGKGQLKTEKRQSGLFTQYAYDSLDRVISETRSGPDMMTEVTTYDYTPLDPSDPVLPVDTRPRTVVRKLNNIECERTYYVHSPLTNIVERVGTQGAAFGGTNVLRTVTAFYPIVANDLRSGLVASIRHEDGKLDVYDYSLVSNLWVETITHLHEQSPSPVSGKTTRDITLTNARGEIIEQKTEAFIDGIWYTIARNRMTYNAEGKRTSVENLAGQVTTTAWDCCHKVSETEPDGSTTTWDYDDEGRMIASSRLIPLDMTNVTWLTTCYEYDDLGRQVATWQTNLAAQVGLPVERTRYDQLGRVIARVDQLGNTTTTEYSPDGRTISVCFPNGAMHITSYSANGDILSVVGTAITPEFTTHGIFSDGICWTKIVDGENALSPRFTKHYDNMLVQIVREERSGFNGAVLSTTHSYDSLGRLVSTAADYEPTTEYTYDALGNSVASTRFVEAKDPSCQPEWRKTETRSAFIMDAGTIWFTQTNIVSCSDVSIAPLVASSAQQLTGLTAVIPARLRSTDIRGKVTENESLIDSTFVTSRQTVPYATNKPLTVSRFNVSLMDVSVSAVTNTVAYDALGRQIAETDGRGNMRRNEYNVYGQHSAFVDALGRRVSLAYDRFGNFAAITNAVGRANVFEFDHRHRKTYEGGATYPARYEYDVFGNKTLMATYRDEVAGGVGDVTTWRYDEATGLVTNKVYADGKGPTFTYTPDGKLARRVWARGVSTDYAYDGWGSLTNVVYSDGTSSISVDYDVLGRELEVRDAAGVTTFAYDSFGSLTNETVVCAAGTNTIERFFDTFGRDSGYALNGIRQTVLAYDASTGRLMTMQVIPEPSGNRAISQFAWSYLPCSDWKASLAYPNGLTVDWQYEADYRLRQVRNSLSANTISQYDFDYDAAGRRIAVARSGSAMSENSTDAYEYNDRSELVADRRMNGAQSSVAEHAYVYDDIGNRITSVDLGINCTYAANNLNQYTEISNLYGSVSFCEGFRPQYDDDGNQTLVRTATGVWTVSYNGENRPVLWSCGSTNIVMSYDRMGRRVAVNGWRFIYDGYLQIARRRLDAGSESQLFIWDPTEPSSSSPLVWVRGGNVAYYTHDGGNKNISEVVLGNGDVSAHYEYAPYGALTSGVGSDSVENPWRFSSEYSDDGVALVYYNYRHYDSFAGRWLSRDPIDYGTYFHEYIMLGNSPLGRVDALGMDPKSPGNDCNKRGLTQEQRCNCAKKYALRNGQIKQLHDKIKQKKCSYKIRCDCCTADKKGIISDGYTEPTVGKERSYDVTLCWNAVSKTKGEYEAVILHELVHVFDHCRTGIKKFNCAERTCSELHAYSHCGVCKDGGFMRQPGESEEACIRRGVKNSIDGKPGCPEPGKSLDETIDDHFWDQGCLTNDAKKRIRKEQKESRGQRR